MNAVHESIYRCVEFGLAGLGLIVLIGGSVFAYAITTYHGDSTLLAASAIGSLVAIFVVFAAVYRKHRWTIEAGGVRIEERPYVPFMGFGRRAFVPFSEIAALRHIERAMDNLIQLLDRKGRVFLIDGTSRPQDDVMEAASQAGHPLPPLQEGLSFWNRPTGLGALVLMLILSLGLAAVTAVYLLSDEAAPGRRNSQAAAIALLLPVGLGYFIWRALKRRREVLRA